MELTYKNKKSQQEILGLLCNYNQNINFTSNSILIKGDNFSAMAMLMNGLKGKIDLIYIDPPFNTNQSFFCDYKNGRYNTISKSQGVVAYNDIFNKEEYIEFMRERIVLMKELLSENGSIYLHIDCKMGHYLKIIMDEIFGEQNFRNDITRKKSNPKNFYRTAFGNEKDMILFYTKNKNIWNDIKTYYTQDELKKKFQYTDKDGRRYTTIPMHAPGETKNGVTGKSWRGIAVPKGRHWRTDPIKFDRMDAQGLIEWSSTGNPRIKKYADCHKGKKIQDIWEYKDPQNPIYPTEKNSEMLKMIILQSSNDGSIVFDCFAGSGSTLRMAEKLGRKWVGIDNSNTAIEIIQNNVKSKYDYYDITESMQNILPLMKYGAL
jgi:adenine-specific DNA-methyltransferase